MTDWTPSAVSTLVAKWLSTGNQQSWNMSVITTGVLRFQYSTDGASGTIATADSSVAPTVADGESLWVRVTRVKSTGVHTFYTSADGVTWTQLGTTATAGAGAAMFSGSANLQLVRFVESAD